MSIRDFYFVNEITQEETLIQAEISLKRRQVSLRKALKDFELLVPSDKKRCYCLEDVLLNEPFVVDPELLEAPTLRIYYFEYQESERGVTQLRVKKERSKQSTIREAIINVKRWRQLSLTSSGGVRMSLAEAAIQMGVSKKSLDDYFCQLRLGEKYGFDFMGNLDCGVGELRAFVKHHRSKNYRTQRSEKHPRILRILDLFEVQSMDKAGKEDLSVCQTQGGLDNSTIERYLQKETVESRSFFPDSTECFLVSIQSIGRLDSLQLHSLPSSPIRLSSDNHLHDPFEDPFASEGLQLDEYLQQMVGATTLTYIDYL